MPSSLIVPAAAPLPKDGLGCASSLLSKDIEREAGGVTLHRKCMRGEHFERIAMPACERGFLIGISLNGGHRRTIYRGAKQIERLFEHNSIYIRDFSEDFHADLYGNFDLVLVELSRAYLDRLGDEHDMTIRGLTCAADTHDPILGRLAQSVADNLDAQGTLNTLFVDQMGLAIGSHLARHYGNGSERDLRRKGMLSHASAARAKELLMESVPIAEVASECDLSRGYFIRAFTRTTGRTPHQWLLEHRVTQARQLIEATDMTLTEIAVACGFADQSHLNRMFVKYFGRAPGAWRRGLSR
ncbi:helix-turn-helix transcriptional regulator [Trinickia violacea]|uniref:Helix-turn-helix transcriptional regulator n=1 Tax=Trinickia violacea TaxID=2571746 RepID=A0A4P8IYX9_9BURK|nr:AraC family transcriptional regulator [Trinickia violacea]QCP53647.1 helix-turn-helix transcriptional regulator [Trinickia violacea]